MFAQAQSDAVAGAICKGADSLTVRDNTVDVNTVADCNAAATGTNVRLNNLIKNTINLLSLLVGIIAVIMMIYGGFRYITSGGDSGNVTSAKNTILYAIVGLIIVALAQFIVRFVLGKAVGAVDSTT